VLAVLGAPAHAQVAPVEAGPATASASVGLRRTSLRSQGAWMLGGDALISFGGSFSLGGGGWTLAEPIRIPGAAGAFDLDLAMSYAGVQAEYVLTAAGAPGLALRLLVGAGSATLSLPVVGTETAADNFGVIEPEAVAVLPMWGFMKLRAQLGYRFAHGVEDLPQVAPEHLRGATASLAISLGPF